MLQQYDCRRREHGTVLLFGSLLVSYRTLAGRGRAEPTTAFGALLAQEDFKNTYTWMWNTVPGTAFGGTTAWTVLPSGSTTAICWPGDLRGRRRRVDGVSRARRDALIAAMACWWDRSTLETNRW